MDPGARSGGLDTIYVTVTAVTKPLHSRYIADRRVVVVRGAAPISVTARPIVAIFGKLLFGTTAQPSGGT